MDINENVFRLSFILFILGLSGLIYVSSYIEPIPSNNFYKYIGDSVYFYGEVIKVEKTKNNNTKFLVSDNYGTFYVVIPKEESYYESCKHIEGYGVLSYFYGNYYIHVFSKRDLKCK